MSVKNENDLIIQFLKNLGYDDNNINIQSHTFFDIVEIILLILPNNNKIVFGSKDNYHTSLAISKGSHATIYQPCSYEESVESYNKIIEFINKTGITNTIFNISYSITFKGELK